MDVERARPRPVAASSARERTARACRDNLDVVGTNRVYPPTKSGFSAPEWKVDIRRQGTLRRRWGWKWARVVQRGFTYNTHHSSASTRDKTTSWMEFTAARGCLGREFPQKLTSRLMTQAARKMWQNSPRSSEFSFQYSRQLRADPWRCQGERRAENITSPFSKTVPPYTTCSTIFSSLYIINKNCSKEYILLNY